MWANANTNVKSAITTLHHMVAVVIKGSDPFAPLDLNGLIKCKDELPDDSAFAADGNSEEFPKDKSATCTTCSGCGITPLMHAAHIVQYLAAELAC